ncbi:hypothetical protein JXJ21_25545 [candidate division KSB1 bacterium]|nr:hypothetical protein [candidate division KSB1 bacterium]
MNTFSTHKLLVIFSITFISIITILSTAFHYPIHFIDALSSEVTPNYTVHISAWRVLGEPFFGPVLYVLRADQPLKEYSVLLIWILSAMLLYYIYTALRNRNKLSAVIKVLLSGLAKLLVAAIIWIAVLLIMIFAPLPSNTIVNHTADQILLNIHAHTEYSHDGLISHRDLLQWHHRNGFDAFFMTDHNHHLKTLEAVQAQKAGTLPAIPLILAGEEFSGGNHILLLGLKRDFSTRGLSDSSAVDSAHANGGVAIVAHWFDGERRPLQYLVDCGANGFEIVNQGTGLSYNRQAFRKIVDICTANDLLMLGACDYHGYGSACFTWNALTISGWRDMDDVQQQAEILDILRQQDQDRITVLCYRDRDIFDRSKAYLSPLLSFIGYFRSLNFMQLLSWIIWILIFLAIKIALARPDRKKWLQANSLRLWGGIGVLNAAFILAIGIMLLRRIDLATRFNEIYAEFGNLFLFIGLGSMLFSMILVWCKKKRRN